MTPNAIPFTKMHALGNDFVVINAINHPLNIKSLNLPLLSNRQLSIGYDQLLIIEASNRANFFCRIFNADGSEAEQCGNGLRCVARFLHEEGLHKDTNLTIETIAGVFPIAIPDYEHIRVTIDSPLVQQALKNLTLPTSIITTGNPHAIIKVDSLNQIDRLAIAVKTATHSDFPNGVNVGFMQLLDKHHIQLRTVERGAGETLACGSNACAAAAAGIVNGWLNTPVTGDVVIDWEGEGKPLHLSGPATCVFTGTFQKEK
jgi:diaminopimelate epimerase